MYLKSLELQGFKTFANRTHVAFGRGVTAIIGPNGCGKSNIVDCIKWVLGEQSAKSLRGGEMLDVIFNGNKRKKPGFFAEGCLIINNEDHSLQTDHAEVSIRRRLSRDGVSEYFMNEQLCRLKDIRELFMDTGVGAKTNTVIEQEQLHRLLLASGKERKQMIEEAAGISRFRQRRHETSSRLQRVQENVQKLQVVVDEVERKKRSVSAQAAKARRYESLQKDLRTARLDLATIDLHNWIEKRRMHDEQRAGLKERSGVLKDEELEDQKKLSEADGREVQLEEEMTRFQKEQEVFFKTFSEAESVVGHHQQRMGTLEQQVEEVVGEIVRYQKDLELSRIRLSELQDDEGFQQKVRELEERISKLRVEKHQLSALRDRERSVRDALRDRELKDVQARAARDGELARAESQLSHFQKQSSELDTKIAKTSLELQKWETGAIPENDRDSRLRLDELRAEKKKKIEKGREIREHTRQVESEIHAAREEGSGLRSRHAVLRENEENFQGVASGVKGVLGIYAGPGADASHGVRGLVADLLDVPEDYLEAIEAVLGFRMQNIVTDTAEQAKRAIQFLRERKLGRVTFLPLDQLRPRNGLNARLKSMPGVIGEAYDLIRFNAEFTTIFGFLLKGVLVVDTLDHALSIFRTERCMIATLQGDIVSPDGAMSGGGKSGQTGLISRKHEISKIEEELAERDRALEKLMGEHSRHLAAEENLENTLQTLDRELQELERRSHDIDRKQALKEYETIRLRQEHAILLREKEELEKAILGSAGLYENIQAELKLEVDTSEVEPRPEGIDEVALQDLEQRLHECDTTLRQVEIDTASLKERAQSSQKERQFLTERREDLAQRLERCDTLVAVRREEQEKLRQEFEQAQQVLAELQGEKNSKQSHYFVMRDEREKLRQQRRELQEALQQRNERLRELDQKLTDLAVADQDLRTKQEGLFHRIHEEFHIDIEELYYSRIKNEDALFLNTEQFGSLGRELREAIAELENKLTQLGGINFEAVDELVELERRDGELQAQMTDLKDSYGKLDEMIMELDARCNKMFEDTFNQIDPHFSSMFKKLFGGGEARLEMEQGVDPLEAGISIFAQPPGKSPKVLTQLSGGEKTLTTLAFLLAIFLFKPSPFCVLDEIDAPLDEHNIDRFMEAIRSFTDQCQFLIVTHNRRTMSLSDIIHGVTMQEMGVSNCMSVPLGSFEFEKVIAQVEKQ